MTDAPDDLSPSLQRILAAVNVASADDGRGFTQPQRRDAIRAMLADSSWQIVHDGPLSVVYAHADRRRDGPVVVVSCHIDSLYKTHFARPLEGGEWLGTFDNSVCNAVLIDAMLGGRLPADTLVTFTGDEEEDGRGAAETARFLRGSSEKFAERLRLVLVMDITGVGYADHAFTIENAFVGEGSAYADVEAMVSHVRRSLGGAGFPFVPAEEAEPDETWNYDDEGLTCFLLALPTAPGPGVEHDDWMHDDRGCRVRADAANAYAAALSRLLHALT